MRGRSRLPSAEGLENAENAEKAEKAENTASHLIDARLLPVAGGLWVGEASVLVLGGRGLFGVLVVGWIVAIALGLLIWLAMRRRSRRRSRARSGASDQILPAIALSLFAALSAGWLLAGLRLAPLVNEQITSMGAQHAVGDIEARIDAPPRPSRTATSAQSWTEAPGDVPQNWLASATLTAVREGGRTWTMSVPVLLVGSQAMSTLTPGTTVGASASMRQGDPSRGTALVVRVRGSPKIVGQPPWWQQVAAHVRESMRVAVKDLAPDQRGLLPGLVVGDESGLSEDLRGRMQHTGLSHLTAVSGANLAIITGLVLGVAVLFRLRRWFSVLVAGCSLLGFVLVVGPQPSVLRAAVMGLIALSAFGSGRRRIGVSALTASAVAVLLLDPWMSVSMGFALSVAATGGLLLYAAKAGASTEQHPGGNGVWIRLRRGARLSVGVAVAAQLATLPLVASFGEGVPVVGVVANLLAEPVVPFATILGCLAAVVASIAPVGGPPLAHIAGFATWWIASVARWCSDLPAGVIPWPSGLLGFVLGSAFVVLLLVGWSRRISIARLLRSNPRGSAAVVATLIAVTAVFRSTSAQWPPPGWVMVVCDVGQGDAIVLETGPGRAMVIDAGPADQPVDRCLSELGVRTIDMLVLSHFHADHVDGLRGVISGRGVGTVMVSPLPEPALQQRNVTSALVDRSIPIRIAAPGEEGLVGAVRYRVLWPTELLRGPGSAPNNASVTLSVDLGNPPVRVLLTGDLEAPAQQALLAGHSSGRFDVVKVPHHGSRNQSGGLAGQFPAAVAVISVGANNRYGHPAANTIADWENHGAKVVRTDQFGDVAVGRGPDQDLFVVGHGPEGRKP